MNIEDLHPGVRKVELEANIVQMEEAKKINTKYGQTKVANATIEDDTDKIKLVLWGDNTEKVSEGDKIKISNGYVKEYKGEPQVSVGKYGTIEKID